MTVVQLSGIARLPHSTFRAKGLFIGILRLEDGASSGLKLQGLHMAVTFLHNASGASQGTCRVPT